MRMIHTGDWHLGKNLEGYSRIDEQKLFLDELCEICQKENVDILLIAGDVYDSTNPSAEAEKLFYSYIKKLSDNGNRAVVIISGNHDSPNRLTSSKPLAEEFGIIMLGTPKSIVSTGKYGSFSINRAFEGGFEIEKNGEKAVFITMPYPNEKNLNEIISETIEENEFQKNYSQKIKEIFNQRGKEFSDDTINVVAGHFFICNGINTDSERNIQLGGSYAVDNDVFPEKTQYVAMGHLHRPQHIKTNIEHSYYAGSPIQYSKSEIGYAKLVFLVDLKPLKKPVVEKIYLKNYKPIEVWRVDGIDAAIKLCDEKKDCNCYVFLEINTDRVFLKSELSEIRKLKKDVVEIKPIIHSEKSENKYQDDDEKTILEQFKEFYKIFNKVDASDEIQELFVEISESILKE